MRALVNLLLLACTAAPALASVEDHLPISRRATPNAANATQADSIRYGVRITDNNLIGVTISNYGFIGNNFISRSPSLEYPLGLGFEHLVRGGLWIGAQAVDGAGSFTGVTTGAVDGNQGTASQGATEYTPAGLEIKARSRLPSSRFFSNQAVSELDLISDFSDRPARTSSGNEDHRPLNILVRQTNYMWSFADYQHVVFFRYTITNIGSNPLANTWVALYGEMASGNKNAYSTWPPTTAGSTMGSWFNKKWIAFDDSLRLFREHYCAANPIPDMCALSTAPYWMGIRLLGVVPGNLADTSDKKVTFGAWKWEPGSALRDEDVERYAILSAGTIMPTEGDPDLVPGSGDPVEVVGVGPFAEIDPGDSVIVDFAIIGGSEIDDIQEHSRTAQRAYDRGYIVPVPPPSPRFKVVARHNALDFYWDDLPESFEDPTSLPNPRDFEGYRVYVGEQRLGLNRVAQFDLATTPNDTTGFNTGLDGVRLPTPVTIEGVTYQYKYTVTNLRDGFKYYTAVTAYDLGNAEIIPLESGINQNKTLAIPAPSPGEQPGKVTVFPNPYRVEARWDAGQKVRDHYLWFANLPQRCSIKIFTLSGDLVFETDFDGATYHGEGTRGIYDPRRELDVDPPTLSGATFGWNMITREGQAAATGLYMYSVEDKASGDRTVGKFLLVKSDREEF